MREPDLKGKAEAWDLFLKRDGENYKKEWDGCLCAYLLHCTWSHPFWSYYLISGIHLRDIPGVKPAHKQYTDSSHELMIYSIHPDYKFDVNRYEAGSLSDVEVSSNLLTPPDLVHQVRKLTDDQFKYLVQDVVLTIVEGRASPDQDFRSFWHQSIDSLAEGLKEGRVLLQ